MDLMTKYKRIYSEVVGDALQKSLEQVAAEAVKDIIKIGKWQHSATTEQAENHALDIHRSVLRGESNVIDFQKAVSKWKVSGINKNQQDH